MEVLAIVLTVPVVFVCSIVYSWIIGRLTPGVDWVRTVIIWLSFIILTLSVLEAFGVAAFGALKLRELVGVPYYPLHLVLVFLSVPSLANVLVLQHKATRLTRWYVIGAMCAVVGLGAVLLHYSVSEALYGVDGMGGKYGTP